MTKSINTLVDDIYELFTGPHEVTEENLNKFKEDVGEVVKEALETAGVPREFQLRMSNIGTTDRKLWYDSKTENAYIPKPNDYIKFMFGHIIEHLVLFLAREAGHDVTNEQEEVTLKGIVGHKDCHIDGVLVDVKSASSFSFRKFTDGSFPDNDPFGYRYQLKGYFEADPPETDEVAWVVVDKQHGDIIVKSFEEFELPSAEDRIEEVKDLLEKDAPPERCYTPIADDSGNEQVPKNCEWCPHLTNENNCWNTPRVFKYAQGLRYFTKVEKKPRVPEVTHNVFKKNDDN